MSDGLSPSKSLCASPPSPCCGPPPPLAPQKKAEAPDVLYWVHAPAENGRVATLRGDRWLSTPPWAGAGDHEECWPGDTSIRGSATGVRISAVMKGDSDLCTPHGKWAPCNQAVSLSLSSCLETIFCFATATSGVLSPSFSDEIAAVLLAPGETLPGIVLKPNSKRSAIAWHSHRRSAT